jgi:cysteinyl-tRNA synthetase
MTNSRPTRAEVEALVCARSEARTTGNWEVADEIRATLDGWGFGVQDAPDGSTDVVDIRGQLQGACGKA